MNQYPAWKYMIVVAAILVGILFALPNIYGEDPALQISSSKGMPMDAAVSSKIEQALVAAGHEPVSIARDARGFLIRFSDPETQLTASDIVARLLGDRYTVALNLAPAAPEWLLNIGALPMNLGLDLRGGVHFLMEVDMDAAIKQAEERYVSELRSLMRDEKIRYKAVIKESPRGVRVRFRDAATRDKAVSLIGRTFDDLQMVEKDSNGEYHLLLTMTEKAERETKKSALQQNITTLRKRVNELGVAEPVIQQQGAERIVVQLPGVQDTARAKDILGATATLEFRMVDTEHAVQDALGGHVPAGSLLYRERDNNPVLLKKRVMLTGEYIIDASSGIDQQTGGPKVSITLDGKGAGIFSRATRDNIGKPMAVVFIESKSVSRMVDGIKEKVRKTSAEVINIATIRDQLGKRFQITGLDSTEEARNLALLLRAGSLAAPIEIIEERTIGPSLGQDNIDQGMLSVMIGFACVLVFMVFYYRFFGLVANLALTFNLVIIVALLSMLGATLTLPGIAGIVLTVGMAVDANVLIFERIREELKNGNSPHASINAGYDKAFSTIFDANITTLIAALVLFGFGTGPIKGFAVTLSLGIMTSMFTAIMGTRSVINLYYGGRRLTRLSI